MHKIIAGLILTVALVAGCGGESAPESAPLTSAKPKPESTAAPSEGGGHAATDRVAAVAGLW
jgi:hypothetical protein